jgi:hypothetical protein
MIQPKSKKLNSFFYVFRNKKKACPICKADYNTKRDANEDIRLGKISKISYKIFQ